MSTILVVAARRRQTLWFKQQKKNKIKKAVGGYSRREHTEQRIYFWTKRWSASENLMMFIKKLQKKKFVLLRTKKT